MKLIQIMHYTNKNSAYTSLLDRSAYFFSLITRTAVISMFYKLYVLYKPDICIGKQQCLDMFLLL